MIIFNEEPKFNLELSDDVKDEIIENGYAFPQNDLEIKENNSAVLHFMKVDEHVDGNGLSLLWLIEGEGKFFIEDKEYILVKGDVLAFDDNLEHSFSSDVICSAINFTINDVGLNINKIKEIISEYNNLENIKATNKDMSASKMKRFKN